MNTPLVMKAGIRHQHFDKSEVDDALDCFAFGLSDKCRVKVFSRGGRDYKWVMESLEQEEWVEFSTTGSLWYQFWKKPEIRYLSNMIIWGKNA